METPPVMLLTSLIAAPDHWALRARVWPDVKGSRAGRALLAADGRALHDIDVCARCARDWPVPAVLCRQQTSSVMPPPSSVSHSAALPTDTCGRAAKVCIWAAALVGCSMHAPCTAPACKWDPAGMERRRASHVSCSTCGVCRSPHSPAAPVHSPAATTGLSQHICAHACCRGCHGSRPTSPVESYLSSALVPSTRVGIAAVPQAKEDCPTAHGGQGQTCSIGEASVSPLPCHRLGSFFAPHP